MNDWDIWFMEMAEKVSKKSKDPSTKVGAVIADSKNGFVSLGYNGFARNMRDDKSLYENRETKYDRIIHAETNAIFFAERGRLEGSTLYTFPFMPCHRCAILVIQAGIKKVVTYGDNTERWQESFNKTLEYFYEAKVRVELYERPE